MDTYAQRVLSRPTCTVIEAAKVLGVSRQSVYDAVHRGDMAHMRVGAKILIATAPLREALGVTLP